MFQTLCSEPCFRWFVLDPDRSISSEVLPTNDDPLPDINLTSEVPHAPPLIFLLAMRKDTNLHPDMSEGLLYCIFVIYPSMAASDANHWTIRYFLLLWLLHDWRNSHLLRNFLWSNVPVDFFEFLSTKFAACSKLRNRVRVEPRSCDQSCKNDAFTHLATLPTNDKECT